jgi:hypothetical protein
MCRQGSGSGRLLGRYKKVVDLATERRLVPAFSGGLVSFIHILGTKMWYMFLNFLYVFRDHPRRDLNVFPVV